MAKKTMVFWTDEERRKVCAQLVALNRSVLMAADFRNAQDAALSLDRRKNIMGVQNAMSDSRFARLVKSSIKGLTFVRSLSKELRNGQHSPAPAQPAAPLPVVESTPEPVAPASTPAPAPPRVERPSTLPGINLHFSITGDFVNALTEGLRAGVEFLNLVGFIRADQATRPVNAPAGAGAPAAPPVASTFGPSPAPLAAPAVPRKTGTYAHIIIAVVGLSGGLVNQIEENKGINLFRSGGLTLKYHAGAYGSALAALQGQFTHALILSRARGSLAQPFANAVGRNNVFVVDGVEDIANRVAQICNNTPA